MPPAKRQSSTSVLTANPRTGSRSFVRLRLLHGSLHESARRWRTRTVAEFHERPYRRSYESRRSARRDSLRRSIAARSLARGKYEKCISFGHRARRNVSREVPASTTVLIHIAIYYVFRCTCLRARYIIFSSRSLFAFSSTMIVAFVHVQYDRRILFSD